MRTQSICLTLAIVLLCPIASAQRVQTNGINDRQVPYHPLIGASLAQETPRELLGAPAKDRLQADSLRANRMQSPLADRGFIPNGIDGSPRSLRRISSQQSQNYVIDTAIVRSTWDTTRHLYSFNANAKRTSDLMQLLSGRLWVNTDRWTNTYDASNNMLSDLKERWSNGQWENGWRRTFTYGPSNKMLSELHEDWSNGEWVISYRYTYTYDASGNTLSWLNEVWSNGQWANGPRYSYTYDANGNMLSWLIEYCSNGQWVNDMRDSYTYDASNNVLSYLKESWSNAGWVGWYRDTYTYGAKGNVLTDLYEESSNGQWVLNRDYTCTYDSNEKLLTYLEQYWQNGQWVNDWRRTYAYDMLGNLSSCSMDRWVNSSWTPIHEWVKILPLSITDGAGNHYEYGNFYNLTLINKAVVTGVATAISNLPLKYSLSENYPNPFNPSTMIQYDLPKAANVSLNIYNTLGQLVASLVDEHKVAGSYQVQWNPSYVPSGVYFYRLQARQTDGGQAGEFGETKKMILLH
jgi:hypothetical protein